MKKYVSSNDIRPLGDMGARTALLFSRMTDSMYRPEAIFTSDVQGWPGDWEGRTILAQTLLSRVTGAEAPFLKANVEALAGAYNERGYLKGIMPEGEFDEQQLSGHGWLLRGLCEYYLYSGDEKALDMAKVIVENLFMPTKGRFDTYPIKLEERVIGGEFAGNIAGVVRGWHISTDTGCAFIPMDGLSQVYELTKDEKLGELLSEMHDMFMTIDVVGSKVQTHATLSACRGILRLHSVTGEAKYLESAKKIFDTYVNYGMTANYANYNWFGRPEWTEPCAIIDSFIVAMRLYEYTGEAEYAEAARLIWANGVLRSQRANGGVGCDTCAGAGEDGDIIRVRTYEANWCCSMRGGEGLEKALRFAYMVEEDAITALMPMSCEAAFEIGNGRVVLRQDAEKARDGRIVYNVVENSVQKPVVLKVFMPGWTGSEEKYREYALPVAGEELVVEYCVPEYMDERRRMKGDYMLGVYEGSEKTEYISDAYLMTPQEILEKKVKVLFD